MPGTTDSLFFQTVIDQDGSWGTNICKLASAGQADNEATTVSFGNDAYTNRRATISPQAAVSTTSAANPPVGVDLFGWALDAGESGGTGMGSISGRRRVIPATTLSIRYDISIPAPALGGSISSAVESRLYKVAASPGFARTLISAFGATTTQTNSGVIAADYVASKIVAIPEIVFDPGETYFISSVLVSSQIGTPVTGATVANVQIVRLGSRSDANGATYVEVLSGIRTIYSNNNAASAQGVATFLKRATLASKKITMVGVATATRKITAYRAFAVTVFGIATFSRKVTASRAFTATMSGVVLLRKYIRLASRKATFIGVPAIQKKIRVAKSVTALGVVSIRKYIRLASKKATMLGATALRKYVRLAPKIASMTGVTNISKCIRKAPFLVTAVGAVSIRRYIRLAPKIALLVGVARIEKYIRLTAKRAQMAGVALFARALIAARGFNVVVSGVPTLYVKIKQDLLNRLAGGGGTTTIIRRKKIIADD